MGFKKHAKNRQLKIQLDVDTQLAMHYQEWGEKDNPEVLICVHGLTRNGHDFDFLAKHLAKDFRIICPDIWGRGQSEWLPTSQTYGYPIYLQQIKALLDKLELRQVNWLGTSMGGLIGLMLAAESPELIKRMVLNDIGQTVPLKGLQSIADYLGKQMTFDDMNALESYLRQTYQGFGKLADKHWQHLATYAAFTNQQDQLQLTYDPRIAEQFNIDLTTLERDIDLTALWQAYHGSALILRGEDSELLTSTCAEEMSQKPNSKLIEFENTGHAPALMKKKQIELVRDFLFSRSHGAKKETIAEAG